MRSWTNPYLHSLRYTPDRNLSRTRIENPSVHNLINPPHKVLLAISQVPIRPASPHHPLLSHPLHLLSQLLIPSLLPLQLLPQISPLILKPFKL